MIGDEALRLAEPLWLLGLLLLPLLAWRHHRRGPSGALTCSRLPESVSGTWRIHFPFWLRLAAAAALLIALARPQLGLAWEETTTEGIDIQVALDVSGSMGAEDFAFMLHEKPGAYVKIGNGPVDGGRNLHSPHYDFNDDILAVGASYWVQLVKTLDARSA